MSDTFTNPFASVDAASIPDDPNLFPEGTFRGVIESVEIKPTKNGDKVGMNVKYSVPEVGLPLFEWLEVPQPNGEPTPEETVTFSRLKQRVMQFGIGEKDLGNWEPDDLAGREVAIRVTHYNRTNKQTKQKEKAHQVREVEYLG